MYSKNIECQKCVESRKIKQKREHCDKKIRQKKNFNKKIWLMLNEKKMFYI
jgi:hypothetical protein